MLDKYIRLFLEVSFADVLRQVDDENKLKIQKAKEEKKKKDKKVTPEEYANLLNYVNVTTASQRLPRSHLGRRRPKS
jgi:hypothetical protein